MRTKPLSARALALAALVGLNMLPGITLAASILNYRIPVEYLVVAGGTSDTGAPQNTPSPPILSPASLAFTGQPVGLSSTAKTISVSNAGKVAVTLGQLDISGPFSAVSTSCGGSLDVGASCEYSVIFVPAGEGLATGAFRLSSSGGSAAATLTGMGLMTEGSVSTGALAFGNQQVGSTSPVQSVSLVNTGNTDIAIQGVTVSGPYSATHDCRSVLSAGTSCTANVSFVPTGSGVQPGALTFSTGTQPYVVNLSGTGVLPAQLQLDVSSLSLNASAIGAVKNGTVNVSNPGGEPLAITSTAITGSGAANFGVSGCSGSVAPGSSCVLTVSFLPQSATATVAELQLMSNGGSATVALSGSVTLSANSGACAAGIASTCATFSGQTVVSVSGSQAYLSGTCKSSGKWYYEVTPQSFSGSPSIRAAIAGWANGTPASTGNGTTNANTFGYSEYAGLGNYASRNSEVLIGGTAYGTGETVGIGIDLDLHTMSIFRNGVANVTVYSGMPAGAYCPATVATGALYNNQATSSFNFGQRNFVNAVPAGYHPGVY